MTDCRDDNHSDYRDQQGDILPAWSAIVCADCGQTYMGVPEDERAPVPAQEYFGWSDDVGIAFTRLDGRIQVDGAALMDMIRSNVWVHYHADAIIGLGEVTPASSISIIGDLAAAYDPATDTADVTDWARGLDLTDEDGQPVGGEVVA